MSQYESRGDCSAEMLRDLAATWPEKFEGKSGAVFFGDAPPAEGEAVEGLNFCTTIRPSRPGPWLPFPCFSFLRYSEIGVRDSESMVREMLADEREAESGKLFWIGANTCQARSRLCELGKRHSTEIDAEIIQWDRRDPKNLTSRTRQVSIPDHRLFKYLIDCPGAGYSLRLKWLLATGRPVFVIAREVWEPWMMELRPWVHYVPVSTDMTDMMDHRAILEDDTDLYRAIGRNARQFAKERLSYRSMLGASAEAVPSG